jgi:hypothetical protein
VEGGTVALPLAAISHQIGRQNRRSLWRRSEAARPCALALHFVRRERVEEVRRWLANYQKLKDAIEAICELNHDLLRPDRAASKPRKKQHD